MNAREMTAAVFGLSLIAACGGGGKKANSGATTSTARAPEPEEEPEPEAAPAPKREKPKQWYAKAALTPTQGAKLKPSLISLSQREGDETSIESDSFTGAKPGTYWLVVHEGDACGPNATKAGSSWSGSGDAPLRIVIAKDLTGGLESNTVGFALTGGTGAIGHVLVLHDDKKGKPGKALACGVIEEVEEP